MNILVVVDMQNDFIDGSLGTEKAQRIVPEVVKRYRHLMELCLRQEIPMKRTIWRRQKEKTSGQTLYPWNKRLADQTGDRRSSDRGAC